MFLVFSVTRNHVTKTFIHPLVHCGSMCGGEILEVGLLGQSSGVCNVDNVRVWI